MAVKHKKVMSQPDPPDGRVGGAAWDDDHAGNSFPGFIVAATDSSAKEKTGADYLCDGTADDVQLQAAIDALESAGGGDLALAEGTYTLAAGLLVDSNVRIRIIGYGATIKLPASVSGIKIKQGNVNVVGARVEGLLFDGQSNSSTVAVEFEDTNNAELANAQIKDCTTGVLLDSQAASAFVEGCLIDTVVIRGCTTGIATSITSGTGSFAQTVIRNTKITTTTTGISIPQNSIWQRSYIQATVWIGTNQTAISLDGNIEDSTFEIGIEGTGGATGNTGLSVGTNCTNEEQAYFRLHFTGTIATQMSSGTNSLHYWSGGSQIVQSAGTAVLGYKRHGDSTDRLRFEGLTAGGRIQFGTGSALDTRIYRNGVAVLSLDNVLLPTGVTVAGLPTAAAGMIAYVTDSTTGTWGATISGGGSTKVIAFYNGTNWTVMGA